MSAMVAETYPIVTFAEIESLTRLAILSGSGSESVRLPFLPPEPRADVLAAGLSSLFVRGHLTGTIGAPEWSVPAATVGQTIAGVSRWVEFDFSGSIGRSYFGTSADGAVRVLVSLVAFGSFQVLPIRTTGDPVESLLAILLGVAESSDDGQVTARRGVESFTLVGGMAGRADARAAAERLLA